MYPHERSLVKRLQNHPFALLGVNSDEDREQLKEVLKTEQITWRSFWAGGSGGPIPAHWQVRGWPTIFIIDHQGVIRHVHEGNPGDSVLDREIDQLVKEAAAAQEVS
jgi:hypothetical protein